jgi:hypothetical protein
MVEVIPLVAEIPAVEAIPQAAMMTTVAWTRTNKTMFNQKSY